MNEWGRYTLDGEWRFVAYDARAVEISGWDPTGQIVFEAFPSMWASEIHDALLLARWYGIPVVNCTPQIVDGFCWEGHIQPEGALLHVAFRKTVLPGPPYELEGFVEHVEATRRQLRRGAETAARLVTMDAVGLALASVSVAG